MNRFDAFLPRAYLAEFYSEILAEDDALLKFFAENAGVLESCHEVVDIGGGPTIYPLISIAPLCRRITFCDYLRTNLDEVRAWASDKPESYDWSVFIERSLVHENKEHGPDAVKARESIVKEKIVDFLRCDAFQSDPIGEQYRHSFDVISSHYVSESITSNKRDWDRVMSNILSLLKPSGHIFMTFTEGLDYWLLGAERYSACNLTQQDIVTCLAQHGFSILKAHTIFDPVSAGVQYRYAGRFSLYARREQQR